MGYGLGVWGPDGTQWLGDTDRVCRYQGRFLFGNVAGGSSLFISVPGFRNDGTWFYICVLTSYAADPPPPNQPYKDVSPSTYNIGGEGYLVPTNDGITFVCTMTANGFTRCAYYDLYVWRG